MTARPVPASTYRLQLTGDFTFDAAAQIVDYLSALGIDWVYLSPVLQAEPGSDHGYDVVDHRTIDRERGGRAGFDAFVDAARANNLGVLVDIVPNHMGVLTPHENNWWWDVLTHGRDSEYANAFDIDWEFGAGRLRLPVLADDDLSDLRLEDGELRYFGHRFPLAPGTAEDEADAREVHDHQHYELVAWRRENSELNYRRFFAVTSLAGIRVERQKVFDDSHTEIRRWFDDGQVNGLRVDHPDGLADPGGYLTRLQTVTNGAYVVVEKILEGREELPSDWPVAGTSGYDALADFDRVLVDDHGVTVLDELERELHDELEDLDVTEPTAFHELTFETKRTMADSILRSEVLRLARDVARSAQWQQGHPDTDDDQLADAIAELLTCFPVYRTYLPDDVDKLYEAASLARKRRPELNIVIGALLGILSAAPEITDDVVSASARFQQTSGSIMAKGVEDSAFYRYSRLTSLNEVGADPAEFSISVDEFHARQQRRLAAHPFSMTTLSTHDTKRGEDTRARISVISELPGEWRRTFLRLRELVHVGDAPLENLVWQAIVGSWPATRERLHAYVEKASREAGNSTAWTRPDTAFESRLHSLVDSAFDDTTVIDVLVGFLGLAQRAGWSNGLSAKLLQLTSPGVPDVYQGSELWETSLVDPDNRRAVDYDVRRRILRRLADGELPRIDETGAAKALVTMRALRLRREHPELFTGYRAITATGSSPAHAIVFDRGGAITVATRLSVSLARRGGWGDSAIDTGHEHVRDEITGRVFEGPRILLSDLLSMYPVALLVGV